MRITAKLWMVALGAMVLLLVGCGDRRTPDERIEDARASMEKSRYRDAIINMRSLLRALPDNAEARATLGEALLSVGDSAAAEKEYLRARDAGAPASIYLEPLARAWQSRGAHHEVLAEVNPRAVEDTQLSSTLRALRGRSLLGLGSRDEAQRLFDRELEGGGSDEAQRISLLGKATIARELGEFEQAEVLIQQALAVNDRSAESVLALGRFYIDQHDYAKAKALLVDIRDTQMRARRKDWFDLEAQLTESLLGLGELEAARESAASLTSLSRTHPMAAYLQGRVELDSHNLNEAVQYFQQVLSDYPGYAPALTLMGVTMIDLADFDQAEMHLSAAVVNDPTNVQTRRLLAETRMRLGRTAAAVATLKAGVRNNSADSEMIAMLGRESLRLGDTEDGLRYLNDALAASPDNLQANLALAQAHLSSGDTEKAVAILRNLPEASISDARRRVLIQVAQIDRSDVNIARQQIEVLLDASPNDVYVMGLAGSFYAAIDELDEARRYFQSVLAATPGNRSAMLSILDLDERIGDYTEALALFEAAHQKMPGDLLPALVLARIHDALGDQTRALEFVRLAHSYNPQALLPNLMLAAQDMRDGLLEEAESRVAVTVEDYPKSARAHALNGQIKMRLSNIDDAVNSYRRAILYDADNAQYRFYLGQAEWANKRFRQARTSFKDALRRDERHLGAMRAVAMLEARASKDVQADQMIQRITATYANERRALLAIGDVRAAQERYERAIELYEQASQIMPSWPLTQRLYQLRRQQGIGDPLSSLKRWLASEPSDARALVTLAQGYQRMGDSDNAITHYEKVLTIAPDMPLAMNNLAWLYQERGGPDDAQKAVEMARSAYEQSPGDPDVADTYGWMLVGNEQVREGRALLREALLSTTPSQSPDIAYHYAATLSTRNDLAEIRALLDEALASEQPFASRNVAQDLRNSL